METEKMEADPKGVKGYRFSTWASGPIADSEKWMFARIFEQVCNASPLTIDKIAQSSGTNRGSLYQYKRIGMSQKTFLRALDRYPGLDYVDVNLSAPIGEGGVSLLIVTIWGNGLVMDANPVFRSSFALAPQEPMQDVLPAIRFDMLAEKKASDTDSLDGLIRDINRVYGGTTVATLTINNPDDFFEIDVTTQYVMDKNKEVMDKE